jgi:DNA-binding response OmpR family regulator
MLVLVVEDEPMIAASIEWELTDAGHQVLGPAASADEAMALTESVRPDIALVDINLGGRDDGVALARDLKTRLGAPVVFVTGQLTQARQARDAAIGVLPKPFSFRALVATIPFAAAINEGRCPSRTPQGLELFQTSAAAQAS